MANTAAAWAPPSTDPDVPTSNSSSWSPPTSDPDVASVAHPVTDEVTNIISNEIHNFPRNVGKGLADTGEVLSHVASGHNATVDLIGGEQSDDTPDVSHPVMRAAASEIADRLGIPKRQGQNSQITQVLDSAVQGGAGGALMGPEAIIPSAISAASSETARQMGAGPVGQFAAGMLPIGPGALSAGAKRYARRGAEVPNMQANLEMFDRAGVSPDLAQIRATENPVTAQYEAGGGNMGTPKLPGGGSITATRGKQAQQAQSTIETTAKNQAPNVQQTKGDLSPTTGGQEIDEGLVAHRKAQGAQEAQDFQNVEHLVGRDTPMEAQNFQEVAKTLAHPTKIPEVNDLLAGPKTAKADVAGQAVSTPSPASPHNYDFDSVQSQPVPQPPLTYGDLRAMRTRIGNDIDWGLSPSSPGPNSELKRLYTALGADLQAGVAKAGPLASNAYKAANARYAANAKERSLLDPMIEKGDLGGPEGVFKAATAGTKEGSYRLAKVVGALAPEQVGTVRGVVINRMGHPGGALDKPWNENTYLDNWQSMDRGAKNTLFGTSGTPLRDKLEAVEGVLQLRRNLGYSQSNFATGVQQGTSKALHGSLTGAAIGGIGLAVEHAAPHLLNHPVLAAVGGTVAAGTVLTNPILAKASTNPKILNWLAQASKAPKALAPVLLNQLTRMGPDGNELKKVIEGKDDNGGT